MTEAEWLTSGDPRQVMRFLAGKVSTRKLRLFACACCRRVWSWLIDDRSRDAVDVAERFADGQASESERAAAFAAASQMDREIANKYGDGNSEWWLANCAAMAAVSDELSFGPGDGDSLTAAENGWRCVAEAEVYPSAYPPALQAARAREVARLAPLLRDIVGNPFRPVAFDPAWLTEAAVGIARGIYDDRAFERLPILADALQEAGCEDAELLAHCREPGVHVRGCWVMDLVLGKG